MTRVARLLVMGVATLLSACTQSVMVNPAESPASEQASPRPSNSPSAPTYTVQAGDTLYKISVQYGVDYRELAQWNDIAPPYTIYPRQQLRVGAQSAAPATSVTEATVAASAQPEAEVAATPVTAAGSAASSASATAASAAVTKPAPGYNADLGVTLPEGAEPLPAAGSRPTSAAAAPTAAATSSSPPSFEPADASPNQVQDVAAVPARPATDTTPTIATVPSTSVPAATAGAATSTPSTPSTPAGDVASAKPSAAGWIWPTPGKIVVTFSGGDPTRQGVDVAGDFGQPVRAARDGEVVYSGAGLIGYGELVIIKHSPELLSAYGHNRVRLVKEGDKVKAGQKIAEMGKNASNRVLLHFEVRKNGKPVDPLPLLPAR